VNAGQRVQEYVDGVLSGDIVAGELQRLAVRRYVDDLKQARKKNAPFYFDTQLAEIACAFFPSVLVHSSAEFAGQPFQLLPDQLFIVWNLWGWRRRTDGTRRFRSAHIEAARKWGKTAFVAGLCLLAFLLDNEARPEIYCTATKRSQAKLVWEEIDRFRIASPSLTKRLNVKASEYTISKADRGLIKALGADGGGSDGLFPHVVTFDEQHEWKTAAHLKLWAKLRTGSSARRQPLFLTVTTAGDDQSKLWLSERAYAVKVLNGDVQDDALFAFVLCLDDDDDIFDEDNWPKAQPHLGITAKWDDYRQLALKAASDEATRRDFERYYCNRRVESVNRAISDIAWNLGAVDLPVLSGRIVHGGVDLGWRDDLAALGLCFPPKRLGEPYAIKATAFIPADCQRDLTEQPLAGLIRSKHIIVTPGNTTDVQAIHASVQEAREIYTLKSIAIDPNNARQFGTELVSKGIQTYEFGQQARNWNEPFREFLRLMAAGEIIHGNDPLLSWCQQNLMAWTSGDGLMKPSKQASTEKIDPLVAVLMAFSEAMFHASRDGGGDGARVRIL